MAASTPLYYRTLTLEERLSLLRSNDAALADLAFDPNLAAKRLARWKSQTPFDNPEIFARRLEFEAFTSAELEQLLGMTDKGTSASQQGTETWSDLVMLWNRQLAGGASTQSESLPRFRTTLQEEGFAILARPGVEKALRLLMQRVSGLGFGGPDLPACDDAVFVGLRDSLLEQIRGIVARTLILELHVAKLQGHLTAETPEERYLEFLVRLQDPKNSLALLGEYAVLARLLDGVLEGWLNASSEVFAHLAADWPQLCTTFDGLDPACRLTSLKGGAGDMHRGRRSVHIASFSNGTKLVYKPRSLDIDRSFSALCQWLAEQDATLNLRIPQVFTRPDYGWCTFVAVTHCDSEAALARFYRRLGALLALLYFLQAMDFHYENIIAAGEYPIPIDLEAILHPNLDESENNTPNGLFRRIQEESVLRVGLLPRRVFSQEGQKEGVDISGMGGKAGQISPVAVMTAEEMFTDEMRIVRKHVVMEGSSNQPTCEGSSVSPAGFVEEVVGGFRATAQIVLNSAQHLLADDGLIQAFAGNSLRLIARPTMTYAKILYESYHPNLLRDAVDRDRLLERLWLGCVQRPYLAAFFVSEKLDLSRGEIPAFYIEPDSTDVRDSIGNTLAEPLRKTTLSRARQSLTQLSDHEIDKQVWWIRSALADSETKGLVVNPVGPSSDPPLPLSEERILRQTRFIGTRLLDLAETTGSLLHWRGQHFYQDRWSPGAVGIDLYNGAAGISIYLAFLGAYTKDQIYTEAARKALTTALAYTQQMRTLPGGAQANLGAFFGQSGLIFCLQELGKLWQDASLTEQAIQLVEQLATSVHSKLPLTLGSGLAGLVHSSTQLYGSCGDVRVAKALRLCAHELAQRLEVESNSLELMKSVSPWMEGLHGIGYALYRAGLAMNDNVLRAAGERALQQVYNDCGFFAPHSSLTDDQHPDSGANCDALHIYASMLRLNIDQASHCRDRVLQNQTVSSPIDTLRGSSFHHGLCREVNLLLDLDPYLTGVGLKARAHQVAEFLLRKCEQRSLALDTPACIETPGLMVGLAGIGMTFLRCSEKSQVPSMLFLEGAR